MQVVDDPYAPISYKQSRKYECKNIYVGGKWNNILRSARIVMRELNDWGSCKKGYTSNPSTFDCECNKPCKIGI